MIFETIRKIISEQLGLDEKIISLDSNLTTDLDADSLDAVEIIMAIEDEFSIEIPDDRIEDLVTIHDLVEYIESSVQASLHQQLRDIIMELCFYSYFLFQSRRIKSKLDAVQRLPLYEIQVPTIKLVSENRMSHR